MIRLFVAFPIPEEISKLLLEYALNYSHVPGVRVTRRGNLHVTLFFIGEVKEDFLKDIIEKLQLLFSEKIPFRLSFDKIEFAGKKKRPSMIWARFHRHDDFTKMANLIYKAMNEIIVTVQQETDPIPHITLARIRAASPTASISLPHIKFPKELLISKAELWQSIQTKEGVVYKSLEKFEFSN